MMMTFDFDMLSPYEEKPRPNEGEIVSELLQKNVVEYFKRTGFDKIVLGFTMENTRPRNRVKLTLTEFVDGRDEMTGQKLGKNLFVTRAEERAFGWEMLLEKKHPRRNKKHLAELDALLGRMYLV